MKQSWLNTAINRPWLTLLFGILMVIATGYGMSSLEFRGDYKIFFEKSNPQLMAYERIQDEFNDTSFASIVVAPHSKDVFDQETLTLLHEMTEEAWQTPYSTRVDSLTNFQHTRAEDDDLLVEALVLDEFELNQQRRDFIRKAALSEPNLVDSLVSKEGHVAIINITVQLPEKNRTLEIKEVADHVYALSDKYLAKGAKVDFYHGGIVIMNNSFASEAQKDGETLIPAMFLGILIMLVVLLRSITGTLSTMIVIVASIIATLGISGWTGFFLSTATVNVPVIVMTLAVADCVHIIGSMLYYMRQGKEKAEAIKISLELNFMPVLITSVTTAIGFLTMNFSNVPILNDLGNMTAMGVMLAFLFSITLLPSLLRILPIKVTTTKDEGTKLTGFADWVIANHKALLPISVITMAALSYFATFNQVNDEATKYFSTDTHFRQSADFMQDNIGGMTTIDFVFYTDETDGINNPAYLADVEKFAQWFESQPEVTHVNTISNTFKRLNKNMHGDDESMYKLPVEQPLAAQFLLLYEMSLPVGLDLSNQINMEKSAVRLTSNLLNLGSKELTEIEERAHQWIKQNITTAKVEAASPSLMFAHIGETNMQSMLKSLPTALFLISALLIIALRSWQLGFISLVPNVVPAAIGFGIWGLYSGEINLGLSVVASMSLGIIVDDTVHFLSKYRHARVEGKGADDAVRYAFNSVGRALIITTLVLSVGFAILALSTFRLNSDMGLLTGIILVVALIVDFLFLPAFLMVFDRDKQPTNKIDNQGAQHAPN